MLDILPSDFGIPSAPYLIGILICAGIIAMVLWKCEIRIDEDIIISLIPWMAFGAGLRVVGVMGLKEYGKLESISFLLGNPTVYITTFVILGCVWSVVLLLKRDQIAEKILMGSGLIGFGTTMVVLSREGWTNPAWSIVGLVVALVVSILVWEAVKRKSAEIPKVLGSTGLLVIIGQTLDGTSTAIGIDILNFKEQTPISQMILDIGASLPVANIIGVSWLFVCVKIVLAIALVFLFVDYTKEKPLYARILLIVMIAIGIGPGMHNLILYSVVG
ncbi:MAG: DUF63 family protein [Halobacteriales archaeon]|tara:strand:- start:390 stop:1211 length:822 start_codon:yes stop_codon:yes gene_type:complete